MDITATKIITGLILPPGVFVLMFVVAVLIARRWSSTAQWLVSLSFVGLFVLSMPPVAVMLTAPLETTPPLNLAKDLNDNGAIVVLGGGRYNAPPEYTQDVVAPNTLLRLRYGAYLHRRTGIPMFVTGGNISKDDKTVAQLMQSSLKNDFGVAARWVEGESRTTRENAEKTREILEKQGIDKIILVTTARHMPRSLQTFRAAGFTVEPAPTAFVSHDFDGLNVFDFLPSAVALSISRLALHEYVGMIWYHLSD